jgi:hypothetical protein
MINFKNLKASSSPFNWFVLDNVLDEELFYESKDEVKSIFKNIDNISNAHSEDAAYYDENHPPGVSHIIGGNTVFEIKISSAEMVINETKKGGALEKLCTTFLNKNVQKYLYRSLLPLSIFDLKSLRPLKVHIESDEMTIFDYIFFKNCFVNLKLSSYTSNFGLYQHKDHGNKVTALLFYFGFTDDIQRNGCSTQLYEVTEGNKTWSQKQAPQTLDYYDDQKLNLVKDVNCLPNRLFGFRKTRNSWHGVDFYQFPSGVRREALQINLMKHYKSSKNLKRLLVIINYIKDFLRPIVKKILGYK